MKTVRHADQCRGNWSEPDPTLSPVHEARIAHRVAELEAEGWNEEQAQEKALRELRIDLRKVRAEQEIYDHEANHE